MGAIQKPKAKVSEWKGHVFVAMGICQRALRRAGMSDKAKELADRVFSSPFPELAIPIMAEYCELI